MKKITKNSDHLRFCQQPRAAHALRSTNSEEILSVALISTACVSYIILGNGPQEYFERRSQRCTRVPEAQYFLRKYFDKIISLTHYIGQSVTAFLHSLPSTAAELCKQTLTLFTRPPPSQFFKMLFKLLYKRVPIMSDL